MHSLTCARKQGEETALEGWGEVGARAVGGVVGRAGEGYASAQGIIAAGHSQGCAMLAAPHLCPGATKVLPSVPDKMFRRSGRQQLREEPEGVLTHALHPSLAAFGPPRRCRRAPTWLDQRAAMGPLHAPAPRKTCLRRHRVYPPPRFRVGCDAPTPKMKVVAIYVRYRILAVCAIEGRLTAPWDRIPDVHDFLSARPVRSGVRSTGRARAVKPSVRT